MNEISLDFKVENTKDNFKIINVSRDNKNIYIGSKYNMQKVIDDFISEITNGINENDTILIYGFSTGDHIKALMDRIQNKIIVFEPNKNMIDYIENIDWIKGKEQLKVFCGNVKEVGNYIKSTFEIFNINELKIMYFSNYKKIYVKESERFQDILNDILREFILSSNTLLEFNKCWFEALLNNIPYILQSESIENYKDKFKNKPAIIVSAGPSLEKNIKQLKNLNDNMLIISGGRTLKPLKNIGVQPDLLTIIDSGEASYNLVEEYIEDVSVPLLFYEKTNEKVISKHKGKKLYTTQSDLIRNIADKELKNHVVGGSVVHTMAMAAIELGCNPIIFIGQDLAYTGEKFHADIAKYDKSLMGNDAMVDRHLECFVESIDGGMVRTSAALNSFRIELEDLIKEYPEYKFINATEGGARIHGTTEMSLEECIKTYAKESYDFSFNITEEYGSENRIRALKMLNDFKNSIKVITKKCKEGISLIEKIKKNKFLKNDVNSLFVKLDKIDDEIKVESKKYGDIGILLYPIIYKTMVSVQTNEQSFEDVLMNNKRLYKEIIVEFDEIMPVLNSVIEKIE